MQWKFWKRKKRQQEFDLPSVGESTAEDSSAGPLLNPRSATELLGLQRLIGNQAVLQMVKAHSAGSERKSHVTKLN